ncbi:MAG: flavin reductase [Synergistaceae bacterium]|nr:flavin reductase [Synergistaceae bacterium]
MEFRSKKYEAFNIFDKEWGLAAAGTLSDFDGCTIGWGSMGEIWGLPNESRPIITIYVNPLRYTADYLLKHEYFSVSFFDMKYRRDLAILGSKSGRDTDKFALTSLTPSEHSGTVIFNEADLTFICRKLYWEQFNFEHLVPEVQEFYTKHKHPTHYEFIGEVIDVIDKRN